MKKLILLFCAIASVYSAGAQIKVKEAFTNDLIIIGNMTSGSFDNVMGALAGSTSRVPEHKIYCRIYQGKTTYGILVNTSNRFDDDFEFALGTNIETAKESLGVILEFMEKNPLKTSMTVEDEDNRVIQLNLVKRNSITLQAVDANGEIICGGVYLTRKNIERGVLLLDKKAEEKVLKAINKNNEQLNNQNIQTAPQNEDTNNIENN